MTSALELHRPTQLSTFPTESGLKMSQQLSGVKSVTKGHGGSFKKEIISVFHEGRFLDPYNLNI